ncbi:MAG TPA: choice-of-anchor Q domain-containing protein [Chloroflexota bacterium]|nr:choice-of-anchor Q domain-containing protein [Chloroflexota bacterium]HUM68073.1 choice-of-anchor Q domain-containing protein [Chloroflexota bacterium]
MKKFQRIMALLAAISLFVFALSTVLVLFADTTSSSLQKSTPQMHALPDNHDTLGEYTQYLPLINNSEMECDVPQHYLYIQEAVDEPTCSLINVAAGTFFENVVIDRDVTIHGAGVTNSIVDGNNSGTVFDIQPGHEVTLNGLTIRNGMSLSPGSRGGGIRVYTGTLTITDSLIVTNTALSGAGIYGYASKITIHQSQVVSNSFGGGIQSMYGTLVVQNSTLSSNSTAGAGGGISGSNGTLVIRNSTLSDNSAFDGGGIRSDGINITIDNSTLNDNHASNNGGGIYSYSGTLTFNNSTLSGNSALYYGGGILLTSYCPLSGGVVILNNSTLNNNSAYIGGGVFRNNCSKMLVIAGTIIAGKSNTDCYGAIISQGYNIVGDSSCNLNGPGDMNDIDPQLGPLQDNGGLTQTHLPLPDSPAIDTGDPLNCPPTDQRGTPRPNDGDGDDNAVCDIGSVEYYVLSPFSGVEIQGPITGSAQTNYTFTAVITPITATQPITYVWQTAGQTPVTHTGGISDTAVFSWDTSGTHVLTVTASNPVNSATASISVTILEPQFLVYPLIVNKNCAESKLFVCHSHFRGNPIAVR